ncbi:MAG: ATP-binding protein [Candidatus Kryptoniota bacterium]
MPNLHEHIIINDRKTAFKEVEGKLERIFGTLHLSESDKHNLLVSATEAMNNAMSHGNRNDPAKKVMLDVDYGNDEVTLIVEDEGDGFNPKDLADPLLPENLLKPSGRGIHIMKSLMDSVVFEFTPHGTRTIMKLKVGIKK